MDQMQVERTLRNLFTSTRVGQSSGTSLVAAANVQPAVLFVTWLWGLGVGGWVVRSLSSTVDYTEHKLLKRARLSRRTPSIFVDCPRKR